MKRLSDKGFDQVAKRFRLLGDPGRLKMLDLLRRVGELPVGEIAERVGCSQGHASRQLAQLREAGLLERRQDGTTAFYAVADPSVFTLCETVCGGLAEQASREAGSLFETADDED